MTDRRAIDELKAAGAGRPAPVVVVALYQEAFERFGTRALWSRAPSEAPTITQALVVAQSLRNEGPLRARSLAAQIEDACRAAL